MTRYIRDAKFSKIHDPFGTDIGGKSLETVQMSVMKRFVNVKTLFEAQTFFQNKNKIFLVYKRFTKYRNFHHTFEGKLEQCDFDLIDS